MTINELRARRATLWNTMEGFQSMFLRIKTIITNSGARPLFSWEKTMVKRRGLLAFDYCPCV